MHTSAQNMHDVMTQEFAALVERKTSNAAANTGYSARIENAP